MIRSLAFTAFLLVAAIPSAAEGIADSQMPNDAVYARIDLQGLDGAALEGLQQAPELIWWVEVGETLLVLAADHDLGSLAAPGTVEVLDVEPRAPRLHVVRGARRDDLAAMDVDVLAFGGRHAVIQARGDRTPTVPHAHDDGFVRGHAAHADIVAFVPKTILSRVVRERPTRRLSKAARQWSALVDAQRWMADVTALAAFNRYTHGSEIHDARDWLVAQFEAMPGLHVETPSFQVGGTTAYNVVATLTGSSRPDDLFIVGAHYDAISPTPGSAAPGAEDNASGCAGVLELARILTSRTPAATVLFICYSGEEQGLFGSRDHAADLVARGLDDNVRLQLNMDMIGYTGDADLDCLLESNSTHAAIVDVFVAAAATTDLRIETSFSPFGSDHVPYLDRGMPSLLTIENDWDSYPCYHATCDLAAQVDLAMGREILEMNAAALAELIGDGGSIFGDDFESGTTAAWSVP